MFHIKLYTILTNHIKLIEPFNYQIGIGTLSYNVYFTPKSFIVFDKLWKITINLRFVRRRSVSSILNSSDNIDRDTRSKIYGGYIALSLSQSATELHGIAFSIILYSISVCGKKKVTYPIKFISFSVATRGSRYLYIYYNQYFRLAGQPSVGA